jgi:hypothetical protein
VREHLGRQDGVAKANVDLLDGKVTIYPKDDGKIDPARLLKAVYDSGVTVAEMTMTARGRIEKSPGGGIALRVTGNETFPVSPNEISRSLESLAGSPKEVTVRGRLYKKPAGKQKFRTGEPLPIEVLELVRKE